ncbi:hypothetical protein [Azospirillum thermophilum]|uniref:hypothetical protein n=1 Tax=Azospirillum thermophilum TaxID=2202148 RepID=UPI00143D2A0B|nr:hypothetical protein [Azospirillum thermophilum]
MQVHIIAPGDRVMQLQELHDRYIVGEPLDLLAKEVGRGRTSILKLFRAYGLPVRPRGKPKRREP